MRSEGKRVGSTPGHGRHVADQWRVLSRAPQDLVGVNSVTLAIMLRIICWVCGGEGECWVRTDAKVEAETKGAVEILK